MTTTVAPQTKIPLFGVRTLHLCTLCAFAFTQPLLTAVAKQTVYLHDQQFGWTEMSVLLVVLMVLVPAVFVVLDRIVLAVSRRLGGRGRDTVVVALFTILLLSLVRPYVAVPKLVMHGNAGPLAFALAIPGSIIALLLYDRAAWLRSWLTFASLGMVIFPAVFLWKFHDVRRAEELLNHAVTAKNPIPVVFVVFDEFNSITLRNEQNQIDIARFPAFGRLAAKSTWYRNATTVHPRTEMAVPAILTGRYPVTDRPAIAAQHTGNLFQVIEATKSYRMSVFEPISRLCPGSIREVRRSKRTLQQRCTDLLQTVGAVYPRLILTNDIPAWMPPIPKPWFGMAPTLLTNDTTTPYGLFNYPGTEGRDHQLNHFLDCLDPGDKPRFSFLHAVLPHYPWCYLSNGEMYLAETTASHFPFGAAGELGEDWLSDPETVLRNEYRYRLQLGYTDKFIGRMLDRLEATGLMEQCLLIVTADHGVSFRPGHSRRLPDADNLADIVSVPMFIKLPGQTESAIDDRNIESIDLFPTIAEILKLELPEPVDGMPVSNPVRRPRKTLYFDQAMTVIEPDVPQRTAAIKRQFEAFGARPLDAPLVGAATHPDWHGRPISSFTIDSHPVAAFVVRPLTPNMADEDLSQIPLVANFVMGSIPVKNLPESPANLVVAVDGIVQDTGKSFSRTSRTHGYEFLLPRSLFEQSRPQVDVYVVDPTKAPTTLRPLTPTIEE